MLSSFNLLFFATNKCFWSELYYSWFLWTEDCERGYRKWVLGFFNFERVSFKMLAIEFISSRWKRYSLSGIFKLPFPSFCETFKLLLFLRTNESFAKFIVFRFSLRFICDPSIELPSYRTLLLVCEAPPIEPDLKIPGVVVDSWDSWRWLLLENRYCAPSPLYCC